jgi:enoyl-CoA hydratase/carnithine racemase
MNAPASIEPNDTLHLQDIRYEKKAGYALATFHRPDILNAFREQTFKDLFAILEDVQHDPDVRVLILTGQGRAFSSGADLSELGDNLLHATLPEQRATLEIYQDLTRAMVRHPKIIISALNGLAVGVGAEIALASDVRIASENASLMFAEVKRGLFQTNGVMFLLPRLIGAGRATQLMLTGEKLTASEALEYGVITRLVKSEALLDTAIGLARMIANNAPISVRLVKEVMRQSLESTLETVLDLETKGMLECLASQDLVEGTRAFLESREPVYQGK